MAKSAAQRLQQRKAEPQLAGNRAICAGWQLDKCAPPRCGVQRRTAEANLEPNLVVAAAAARVDLAVSELDPVD